MARSEARREQLQRLEILLWKRLSDDVPLGRLIESGLFREMLPRGAGAEAEAMMLKNGYLDRPLVNQEEDLKRRIAAHFREAMNEGKR